MSKVKGGYRKEPLAKPQQQGSGPAIKPSAFADAVADMLLGQQAIPQGPEQGLGPSVGREYPLPSYAMGIWLVGGELMVSLPGEPGQASGHTIKLPLSKLTVVPNAAGFAGWVILLDLLKQRERSNRSATAKRIGNPSSPPQHTIDAKLVKRYGADRQPELTFDSLFGEEL